MKTEAELKIAYSKRLKAIRLERKISLAQMCEKTGIRKRRYLKIEAGQTLPSILELYTIAVYLQVSNQYLLGLCDDFRELY